MKMYNSSAILSNPAEYTEEGMKEILPKKYKHLLWQDELGDDFVLLKYAEVYRLSKNLLRLYVWSSQKLAQLRKRELILNELPTDDISLVDVEKTNLSQIIALGAHRQRPHIKGKWIKSREELLGHRILPYNPVIMQKEVKDVGSKER